MSSKRKDSETTAKLQWKSFPEYLEARRAASGLSLRGLAAALGLNPSHLSRLATGKVTPYPDTCRKIAVYFGDPVSLPMLLAGWIDKSDVPVDEVMREFAASLRDDPNLMALYDLYLEQKPAERENFVRSLRAAFGSKNT
jgi:transcriptional regulator with XRE-family HTH domain